MDSISISVSHCKVSEKEGREGASVPPPEHGSVSASPTTNTSQCPRESLRRINDDGFG